MKKIKEIFLGSFFFLGFLIIVAVFSTKIVAQTGVNLVQNGDFESGWQGWEKNGVGRQEIITEGGRGKVLYQKNDNAGSRVIQWVPIQNEKIYQLTLDRKGGGNVGGGPLAKADEWCLGGSGNRYIQGFRFPLAQNWQNDKWIFKAGICDANQNHRLAIFFDTNNDYKGEIWVDNVNLQEINPYRQTGYSAVIIGEKPLVVDYSYSDGDRSMGFLNKGHSLESASTKVFLPRVLKGAYKKNQNDEGFNSGIAVMNTENRNVNFTLKIYKTDGSAVLKEYSFQLPPYGIRGIWPPSISDWPTSPADPPAVIEADGKVVVSVDLRNQSDPSIDGSRRGASYEGFPQETASKTWYLPIILRNAYNEGWESGFVIQNTENSTASLSISLYGLDNNNYQKTCSNVSIGANAQKIIYFPNSSSNECFPELITNSNYNDNKKYSAKIVSDKKIVVVVAHSSLSQKKSIEENAIPEELVGGKIFVPRVYNNYYGFVSSFTLQNTSATASCIFDVTYVKDNGLIQRGGGNCYSGSIPSLKSTVIYPPNMGGGQACFPEGNNYYTAVIEGGNNCPLAAFYHLAYPKNRTGDTVVNRALGATAFSEKEVSRIFFIPRIYFYSWNWQSGIQIQNAVNGPNKFSLYLLNRDGKVIAQRENVSLSNYQGKSYYVANEFFNDLIIEPVGSEYPEVVTPTPTQIITPTHVPGCECTNNSCPNVCPVNDSDNQFTDVTYDSPIKCSLGQGVSMPTPASQEDKNSWCNRPQRTKGDATGDGVVNEMDYAVYLRAVLGAPIASSYNPDFNGDGLVSPEDLRIWKKSF